MYMYMGLGIKLEMGVVYAGQVSNICTTSLDIKLVGFWFNKMQFSLIHRNNLHA